MDLPQVCQKGPFDLEVKEGERYGWCRCGLSSNQPLCDGAHKGTDFRSLKFVAEKSGTVYLCGCKRTKTPPFCDGSHNTL